MVVKAQAEPDTYTRKYRTSVFIESTPGNINNKVKISMQRLGVDALSLSPYSICAEYKSDYTDFKNEFLAWDPNENLQVRGTAMVQYGPSTECDQGDGEIRVTFKHTTTDEGKEGLKDKWYYKKCMEQKSSSEWSGRGNMLPATEACYALIWDAASARHYTWKVDFVKVIDSLRLLLHTSLLPSFFPCFNPSISIQPYAPSLQLYSQPSFIVSFFIPDDQPYEASC